LNMHYRGRMRRSALSAGVALGLFLGVLLIGLLVSGLHAALTGVSAGIGSALSILAVPIVFAGYALYAVVHRALEVQALAREGVEVDGRVVGTRSFARGRAGALKYQVTYEYRDGAGRVHRRTGFVSEELWRRLAPGAAVELVYLPRKPGVSAMRAEVLAARPGLRGPAGPPPTRRVAPPHAGSPAGGAGQVRGPPPPRRSPAWVPRCRAGSDPGPGGVGGLRGPWSG